MYFEEIDITNDKLLIGIAVHKILVDSDGELIDFKYVDSNAAFCKILKIHKSQLLNNTLKKVFLDNNIDLIKLYVAAVNDVKDGIFEFNTKLINKGLNVNIIRINRSYILTQISFLKQYTGYFNEIYKYRTLFKKSLDIILAIKPSGEIIDCNEQAIVEYGYTRDEMLKLKIFDIRKKRDELDIIDEIKKNVEGATVYETTHQRKDGSFFQVEVRTVEIGIGDDRVFFSIISDISERKRKEFKILQLASIVESSEDAIIIRNYDYKVTSWNIGAEKIFGYKAEEILGQDYRILIPENKLALVKENTEKLLAGEKIPQYEGEFLNKNKEFVYGTINVSLIKLSNYPENGISIIVRNLTEEKALLLDLNNKNEKLNNALNLLRETQVQLMNEDKMASIGQLSAGIAHEINNPLGFVLSNFNTLKRYINKFHNTIDGYRQLKEYLQSEHGDILESRLKLINEIENKNKIDYIMEDLGELFHDTDEGLERIRKIVLALRNFAHENVDGEFSDYELNEGVKNTLIIARNELKYNSEVKTYLGEIPTIKASGSEINQVLLNLIVNASQAIKEKMEIQNIKNEKYGEIIISTFVEEDKVCFSVEDNGAGISKQHINKVFEPFFTTKPVGKGTGLGLSITYEIIKNKHHGDIIIDSEVNKGTKITIKLPELTKE